MLQKQEENPVRIARVATAAGPQYAVSTDAGWAIIESPFEHPLAYSGEVITHDEVVLLTPVEPKVLLGALHNRGVNEGRIPIQAWFKSPHAVSGSGSDIVRRGGIGTVGVEGELGVVIGSPAYQLTPETALAAVLGYTVANDVTNSDQSSVDDKNFQSKAGIGYNPVGPWIETEITDPEDVRITVRVNGRVAADSTTSALPSSVVDTLVYVTAWVPLEPGDVIMTGAPQTFVPVVDGDVVDVTLDGIGTLTNRVVAALPVR
jgi:2-keto-4-pentenoate hydratase/2-oxohepta-3-ene-1,7-dioic acid hydratase in catechol pathway